MANIVYELAVRFGTVVFLQREARKHAAGSAEMSIAEERGRPLDGLDLPTGRPVYWLHAVSMGEVGVAKVLVRELKSQAPDCVVVLSTSTASGLEAARKIDDVDAVVAARFDVRNLVSTMFDAIRPTTVVLVEGDLWRNMLAIARRRGVPVFVPNAKLSAKSLRFYQKFPLYSRSLFGRISRVYAQTQLYCDRFSQAGLDRDQCDVAGNVKLDIDAPPPSTETLAEIARVVGCTRASKVVTFGSLHPGEEIVALRGMERVWFDHPDAVAIIAPRHIDKTPLFVDSIRREFGIEASVYSSYSDVDPVPPDQILSWDGRPRPSGIKDAALPEPRHVTIVDKMGMLMNLYALADVCVVGGTFVAGIGGHNLTEPAFRGKPVLYGPYVHTQLGLHDLVASYNAGRQTSVEAFPEALAALVDDVEDAHRLGENGLRMVADSRGVAARIVKDILTRTAAAW